MYRTIGSGNLWVNEYTVRYIGDEPRYVAGIMEFRDGRVVRERLYVAEAREAPAWRAQWVEPIPQNLTLGPDSTVVTVCPDTARGTDPPPQDRSTRTGPTGQG